MGESQQPRPYADKLYVVLPEDYQQIEKIINCSNSDATKL
jgi:hypothetical protein